MNIQIDFDLSKFTKALDRSPDVIAEGVISGMHDALDDWTREARDIAPLEEGTLRRSIGSNEIIIEGNRTGDGKTAITSHGNEITGSISANVTVRSRNGNRFNYAYYIHELDAGGKKLRHPGTVKRFLDVSAKKNERKWQAMIEGRVNDKLREQGW